MQLQKIRMRLKDIDGQISRKNEQKKAFDNLLKLYTSEVKSGSISIIDLMNTIKSMADLNREIIALEMQRKALIINYNYWNQ